MPRRVFFSFHYVPDNWRVQQLRNIGAVAGDQIVSANSWETIARQGDRAIQNWIDSEMRYKQCLVVLIGSQTASRRWVQYEIQKAWEMNKGVVGVHIHGMRDRLGMTSRKGANPFANFTIGGASMDDIVRTYDPAMPTSQMTYAHISANLENWIDEAIRIRGHY